MLPFLIDQKSDKLSEECVREEVGLGFGGDTLGVFHLNLLRHDIATEHMIARGREGDLLVLAVGHSVDDLLRELQVL